MTLSSKLLNADEIILNPLNQIKNKIHYSLNNNGWTELNITSRLLQFASLDAGKYKLQFMINDNVHESSALKFEIFTPMLIQPNAENGIKHVLLHKIGNKTINISFKLPSKNQLKIIVDDNGIGRKRL